MAVYFKKTVFWLFRLAVWFLAVCNLLAAMDFEHWMFELFAHFAMQYIYIATVFGIAAIYLRQKRLIAILALILVNNVVEVAYVGLEYSQPRKPCEAGKTVSVLQSNIYYANQRIPEAGAFLREVGKKADILVMNEFSTPWREQEEAAFHAEFPYGYVSPEDTEIKDIAIFSRYPFFLLEQSGRVSSNGHLKVFLPKLGLIVYTHHGFTPITEMWTYERNRELARVANELRNLGTPALLTGDFNHSPYASKFREALKSSGLRLAPFPMGIKPTWPDTWWTKPIEIPIDHIMVNPYVQVCERKVLSVPGSDHNAVMNIIQLQTPTAAPPKNDAPHKN